MGKSMENMHTDVRVYRVKVLITKVLFPIDLIASV